MKKFSKFWNNRLLVCLTGLWAVCFLLYAFYFHDVHREWASHLPWIFPDFFFEVFKGFLVFVLFPWLIFWVTVHTFMMLKEVDKR